MESSDEEEIIENNYYDDELDPKEIGQKPSNINNPKIISNLKPQNNNLTNNNIKQVKNTNTSKISSKQSPKPKQIISVSVILPKNTQPQKKNLSLKLIIAILPKIITILSEIKEQNLNLKHQMKYIKKLKTILIFKIIIMFL